MSLVSTYVESKEGKWYQNPVVRGKDGTWYICWDDDEPIELVIQRDKGPHVHSLLSALRAIDWEVSIIGKGSTSMRDFSRDPEKMDFQHAQSYFLKQMHNGPTDEMLKDNLPLDRKPARDGVYFFNGKNGWRNA